MDVDLLYLQALRFLNFRPRSEKEIREYLAEKVQKSKGDNSLIDAVVYRLKKQKYINDVEFAKWLIRSRTHFKPKGKWVIMAELKQKGISQEIILQAFAEEDMPSEVDMALIQLAKKERLYRGLKKREFMNKAGSMLSRRGFSLDTIRKAIDQYFEKMV